jgi:UDP-N-acetylmuramate dehydrogenase
VHGRSNKNGSKYLSSASDQNDAMQSNVSLYSHNTLAIPAQAAWFVEAVDERGLTAAFDFAQQNECPLLVLGEGSNIVLANDFSGLVVLNRLLGKRLIEQDQDSVLIEIGAGENWHQLVTWTLSQQWYGLQNLALIPGTVGAAPIQNIGAYGVELQDTFVSLEAIEIATGQTLTFNKTDCQFAYRESVFKQQWRDKLCITSVTLRLHKQPTVQATYPALAQYFQQQEIKQPSPQQVFDAVCTIRRSKFPDPTVLPNAGCFFKNPVVSAAQYQQLLADFPDLVAFNVEAGFKLAAGWLIEQAGWKGKHFNQVTTHQDHALVIINPNACSGTLVLEYAAQLKQVIKDKFAVELEIEPRVIR